MKNIFKALTVMALIATMILLSSCIINLGSGVGTLRVTNYSRDTVIEIIATLPDDVNTKIYDNTDLSIRTNEYDEFTYDTGCYDVYCYMVYAGADYYTMFEDVTIFSDLRTDIDINVGDWDRIDNSVRAQKALSVKKLVK